MDKYDSRLLAAVQKLESKSTIFIRGYAKVMFHYENNGRHYETYGRHNKRLVAILDACTLLLLSKKIPAPTPVPIPAIIVSRVLQFTLYRVKMD